MLRSGEMRRRKAPPPLQPGTGPMTRRRRKLAESRPPPEDPISNLPDAILGEIISRLSTRDGARTQILAFRWRHLWRSSPLNLDNHGLVKRGVNVAPVISHILSSHPGPGRRFCVSKYGLDSGCGSSNLDAWLRSPALDNLQELEYHFFQQPPASVFRFSASLRALTIGSCRSLPDGTFGGLHFPLLKQLGLEYVEISEGSLQSLIDGCPAMESLLLHHTSGFRRVRINSLTVRSIGVHSTVIYHKTWPRLQELIVYNAPSLERLVLIDLQTALHVMVVSAPKLKTIGFLSDAYSDGNADHLYRLSFGSMVIQGLRVDSLTMAVSSVKILALWMKTLCLDTVVELLKCFPCLEKLYIKRHMGMLGMRGPNNLWRRKHGNWIKNHDIRLKTIVFREYWGSKSQVNFLTFFVLNARMLETMTLQVGTSNSEEFLAKQHEKLQLENRASRAAQFHFTTDRCIRSSSDVKYAHDLDVVDPFKPRC